ncbi:MAG: MFS transporter [Acidimicrobiales bacterium]
MNAVAVFANQTFRSLRSRNFRLFFAGQLVSQAGTWMQSIAIIWVVYKLTDNGFSLGLATAAQFFPVLVLGAWGGVVSDRVDRHKLMIVTQIGFLIVAAAFTVLAFTDRMNLPVIYTLSAVYGVITAMDNPARRALVVEMVDQVDVANAVGLNSALMTGSRVVGPAVAGVLISTVGPQWAFLVNTITFVAILAALLLMDRSALRSPPVVPRKKGQLVEGLRYTWANRELRLTFILLAVIGTLAFEYQVSLPLLAERSLGGGSGTFTLLYSLMSVGSVLGALVVARRTEIRAAFLAKAAIWLGLFTMGLAYAPNPTLAAIAVVPTGFAMVFLLSGSNAVIQLLAAPQMRGRVLSLTAVVFLGSTPIGGPIVGWIGEQFGARSGVAVGGVSSLLVALWVLRELAKPEVVADTEAGDAARFDNAGTAPAPTMANPAA